jgi:hypothetical protein
MLYRKLHKKSNPQGSQHALRAKREPDELIATNDFHKNLIDDDDLISNEIKWF